MDDPAFERAIASTEKLYHTQMAAAVSDVELILAKRKLDVLRDVVTQLVFNYEDGKDVAPTSTQ